PHPHPPLDGNTKPDFVDTKLLPTKNGLDFGVHLPLILFLVQVTHFQQPVFGTAGPTLCRQGLTFARATWGNNVAEETDAWAAILGGANFSQSSVYNLRNYSISETHIFADDA
ncbi:MAG TPA: hypothetical protein VG206_08685, partial [Terriglobia bacterium]|nr:hypothetical protein [Terriglobia bacterium]